MEPEIWIPSKDRIANTLKEDLKIKLQSHPNKQVAFTDWIERNAGILAYIGESQVAWILRDVRTELELSYNDGDYVK